MVNQGGRGGAVVFLVCHGERAPEVQGPGVDQQGNVTGHPVKGVLIHGHEQDRDLVPARGGDKVRVGQLKMPFHRDLPGHGLPAGQCAGRDRRPVADGSGLRPGDRRGGLACNKRLAVNDHAAPYRGGDQQMGHLDGVGVPYLQPVRLPKKGVRPRLEAEQPHLLVKTFFAQQHAGDIGLDTRFDHHLHFAHHPHRGVRVGRQQGKRGEGRHRKGL